jgi:hypothetical protein
MRNIMTSNRSEPNKGFQEQPRERGEDNIAWLTRVKPDDPARTYLLLIGGVEPYAFRLRVAQSHVRHDLTPSRWSHVALLGNATVGPDTPLYEIALQPPGGFGFPAPTNAVQRAELRAYRSQRLYPNIAILGVPVKLEDVLAALARFERQRAVIDGPDLLLRWLGYAWGVGHAPNPLLDGFGVPSAAMIEVVVGAAGFDLTPAIENRSSCPEAIWQAARWWHSEEGQDEGEEVSPTDQLIGAWCAAHALLPDLGARAKSRHTETARAEAAQAEQESAPPAEA